MNNIMSLNQDSISVSMSDAKLRSEFDRLNIKRESDHLLFLDNVAFDSNDIDVFVWPENSYAEEILTSLTASPTLTFRTFDLYSVEEHMAFATSSRSIFLFSRVNGGNKFLLNLNNGDIASIVLGLMNPIAAAPPMEFAVELTLDGTRVLFAIVDQIRLMVFASLIERAGISGMVLQEAEIERQLRNGTEQADYRWLSSLLPIVYDVQQREAKDTVTAGCSELIESGLVVRLNGQGGPLYEPTAVVLALAMDLVIPQPTIILPLHGSGKDHGLSNLMLISGRSIWKLEQTRSGRCKFEAVDGLATLEIIANSLRLPGGELLSEHENDVPGESEQNVSKRQKFCTSCGITAKSGDKYCTSCGAQIES